MDVAAAPRHAVRDDGYTPAQISLLADLTAGRRLRSPLQEGDVAWLFRHGLAARALPLADCVGDGARDALNQIGRASRMRSLIVARRTTDLHALMRNAGVPALFYKGAALGAALGDTLGERPAADVDVLVPWKQVPVVDRILTGAGLVLDERYKWIPRSWERRLECERTYTGGLVDVDLHWWVDTGLSMRGTFDDLWRDRRQVQVTPDAPVDTLGAVDALLVTAVHGCRELWVRGKWMVDAGRQVAAATPQQLADAADRADRRGCRRAFDAAVAVAELLDVPVAEHVRPSPSARAWVGRVIEFGASEGESGLRAGLGRHMSRGATADSRSAQAAQVVLGSARYALGSKGAR